MPGHHARTTGPIGKLIELRRQMARLRLDRAQLEELVSARLHAAVREAYDTVPFYRALYQRTGVDPATIRSAADIARLPVISRADLLEADPGQILRRGLDPEATPGYRTSGTTGEPLAVYMTAREKAVWSTQQFRGLLAIGLERRDRLAVLGPTRWQRPSRLQRLGLYRRINISPFASVEEQARELEAFRPTVLWAYPAALRSLLSSHGAPLSSICRPRMLLTSAENCDGLFAALGSELPEERFNLYGTIETSRMAWECPTHEGLHVAADSVLVEIDDEHGVDLDGRRYGQVVVTVLERRAMPFLRYRLGDYAAWVGRPCSCGSPLPLMTPPVGRTSAVLQLPDGRERTALDLMFHLRELQWMLRFEVRQEALDRIVVEIVPSEPQPAEAVAAIRHRLEEQLNLPMEIEVRLLDRSTVEPGKGERFVPLSRTRLPGDRRR